MPTPQPLPTDARARRARRLAVAQALQGTALDFAALDACPPWLAQPPAARDLLCAHAGAWWLAAALRGCIDGQRLARVCDLLGEPRLTALRDHPASAHAEALGQAPRPLLPPADELPRHLLACGRALLGWSLPADLRAPLLLHLGWPHDEAAYTAFATHPDWARQAVQAALADSADAPAEQDTATPAPHEAADTLAVDAFDGSALDRQQVLVEGHETED